MTSFEFRNGYSRLPTADPDAPEGSGAVGSYGGLQHGPHRDWDGVSTTQGLKNKKKGNLKPGLFHMFGDRWKYAANHMSVAIASHSESEHEAERVELMEIRPKRPKLRRGRIRSSNRSPKTPKTAKQKFRFNIVEEPILPGDTVQRVALRYSIPVSEVRRANNLYHDQDFHALKVVKIPIREHGILTDPRAREKCRKNHLEEPYHSSGGATSDDLRLGGPSAYYKSDDEEYHDRSSGDADDEVGDSDSPEIRDVSIQSALKWKHSQHALLDKFDEELQKVRENTEQRLANLNEVALTMTTPAIQPIMAKKETFEGSLLKTNIDWRVVIVIAVLVGVGVILWVIAYLVQHHGKTEPTQPP